MQRALFIILLSIACLQAQAQRRLFGSVDDPAEQPSRIAWFSEGSLGFFAGFSLIGPQWRSAGRLLGEYRSSSAALRLSGVVRTGLYGTYDADIDEAYDLLRSVDYIHLRGRGRNTYLRFGPLERTRLGVGQIVNFLNTTSSWDERQLGVEASISSPVIGIQAIVSSLGLDGLIGGHFSVRPFGLSRHRALGSLEFAVNSVWDRADYLNDDLRFGSIAFETQIEAWRSGAFSLHPFVSYAQSKDRGDGLFAGADLRSDNFIDVARIHFRVALHFNSRRFLPGYLGPFWNVHNPESRILDSSSDIDKSEKPALAGIHIDGVPRNQGLETELRILIFERFEFWYRFVRNFASTELSEFNMRLFFNAPSFQLMIGQDRASLAGLFSLFDTLGDLNVLRFESSYRIGGVVWIQIEARYTYSLEPMDETAPRYRVERRFDPLVGLRFTF